MDERRRKVECFATDRADLALERIAFRERREQPLADLGHFADVAELMRDEVRKDFGNVQPAIGRDALCNRLAERRAMLRVASTDVLHCRDRCGLSR